MAMLVRDDNEKSVKLQEEKEMMSAIIAEQAKKQNKKGNKKT